MGYAVLQAAAGFGAFGDSQSTTDANTLLYCSHTVVPSVWDPATKTCVPRSSARTPSTGGGLIDLLKGRVLNVGPGYEPSNPALPATPPVVILPSSPPPPPPAEEPHGTMDLWNGLSTGEKVGVVAAGALGLLLVGVIVKKTVFKKNARRLTARQLRQLRWRFKFAKR